MKPIHRPAVRLLLAWLLMFALPFAGHASVHLPAVALAHGGAPSVCPHGAHGAHGAVTMTHASDDAGDSHPAKPGSCAACCVGAVLAPALPLMPGFDRAVSAAIPFFAPHVPSGLPDLPERPPQAFRA